MFLNKVLKMFGLMTIERARIINREFHAEYVEWIRGAVEEDFGAQTREKKAVHDNAVDYANDCFDKVIAQDDTKINFSIEGNEACGR